MRCDFFFACFSCLAVRPGGLRGPGGADHLPPGGRGDGGGAGRAGGAGGGGGRAMHGVTRKANVLMFSWGDKKKNGKT